MGMLRILSEASFKRVPIACRGSEKRRVAQVAVTPFHLPRAALIADLPWETTFSRIDITVFTKKKNNTSGISHFAAVFSFPLFHYDVLLGVTKLWKVFIILINSSMKNEANFTIVFVFSFPLFHCYVLRGFSKIASAFYFPYVWYF